MFNDKWIKDKATELRQLADSVRNLFPRGHKIQDGIRNDVETGVFASQLVTQTMTELFRHEFPETKWVNGGLLTMSTAINEGALEYSYTEMEHGGRAEIVAPNATDLPSSDIEGRNNLRRIVTIATHIKYSTQDLRTARLNGMFDIAQEKGASAREAFDRRLNILMRSGQETAGLRGITNAPGIVVQNAATGNWQTATGAQIVADFTAAANSIMNNTDAVEVPDTALFDVASWTRISTLVHLPAASDRTVLSFLREAFPMIRRWDWEPGLSTADAAGTGPSSLIYANNPMKARATMPMMLTPLPPERKGLSFSIAFESRYGGIIVPRPRSILRLDGV